MDVKSYINAARLRTLPLSVSGIIVGSFLGVSYLNKTPVLTTVLKSPVFWLAIFVTIGFQIISNFANDYGDGVKGTDANRQGEARMVASGKITPKQMKKAIIITSVITLIAVIILIYLAFGKANFLLSLLFFALGIASIVAAIKYTVGKSAYGYSGFGDVFVFLFFGLLSVVGCFFLFTKTLNLLTFLPAISVGLLSTAVLNLNNLRDRLEDKKNNKNTLVVKLGLKKAKLYHTALIIVAFISALAYSSYTFKAYYQFLYVVAFIPLFFNINTVLKNKTPHLLDGELKKVALSTFLFSILFAVFNNLI